MPQPEADHAAPAAAASPAVDATGLAPVVMLRPIRTLVVARDLGFRERAMAVLLDLGPVAFAVVSLDEIVALVDRQRADVVVIDATACAPGVGRIAAALYDVAPRVGVVVVSDEVGRSRHALPAVPKWGWATDLTRAVQTAYREGNPLLRLEAPDDDRDI